VPVGEQGSWGATRDEKIVVRRGGAWIILKLGGYSVAQRGGAARNKFRAVWRGLLKKIGTMQWTEKSRRRVKLAQRAVPVVDRAPVRGWFLRANRCAAGWKLGSVQQFGAELNGRTAICRRRSI
jgi:hypothetical protein